MPWNVKGRMKSCDPETASLWPCLSSLGGSSWSNGAGGQGASRRTLGLTHLVRDRVLPSFWFREPAAQPDVTILQKSPVFCSVVTSWRLILDQWPFQGPEAEPALEAAVAVVV